MDPIQNEETEVLIVGTYPGAKSRELGEYYSDSRNQFWKLMSEVLDVNLKDMDYKTKTETLLKHKIGLWDTIKSCDIIGSSDRDIHNAVCNDFSQLGNVKKIVFNGKKACKYAEQCNVPEIVEVSVVPSSSTANAVVFSKKLEEWKEAFFK
ncbi:MAG: TDG/mug DNA glycosylase family protein [Methanolobus sp. T82-4]|nr:MAG: TDG/mug DNA glycosylase family protein [Methanolobus sp. T82-4]